MFIEELLAIGQQLRRMVEEDDEQVVAYAVRGECMPDTRFDCLRRILEQGIGCWDVDGKSQGEERRTVSECATIMVFMSRANTLAMRVAKMKELFWDLEES